MHASLEECGAAAVVYQHVLIAARRSVKRNGLRVRGHGRATLA